MSAVNVSLPKHALVAQALEQSLAAGEYPVGTTLPSEPELTHRFGVSRHTVRAALRSLQSRGLIVSQQGLGSIVRATAATHCYTQGFASAEDLLQYVADTRVVRSDKREIDSIDAELALWLGCKPGERWWHLTVLRHRRDADVPATLADVYLPYAYGTLLSGPAHQDRPIFRSIEERFGETITEIRQEIGATLPTAQQADMLQMQPAEPVIVIVRRYYGRHKQVLETTRTMHPASRFTYAMNLHLTAGPVPE